MTEEIWKDIKGFSKYQVSNLGRVRNKKNDRVLTPFVGSYLRCVVGLLPDSKKSPATVSVGRLVVNAFFSKTGRVGHLDGNTANNRVDNLVLGGQSTYYRRKRKLSKDDTSSIKSSNGTKTELSKKYGVSIGTIQKVIRGEDNKGCNYRYSHISDMTTKKLLQMLHNIKNWKVCISPLGIKSTLRNIDSMNLKELCSLNSLESTTDLIYKDDGSLCEHAIIYKGKLILC